MIESYLTQLQRRYKNYLRNLVSENPFIPIILRGEKSKPDTTVALHKTIALFQQYEKKEDKPGWTITWIDWNSKKLGAQKWPSRIAITEEKDYLHLLQKEMEVSVFKEELAGLLAWQPEIRSLLIDNPTKVLALRGVWPNIKKVVDYFLNNNVKDLYLRSIPVPVHSKFIEDYRQPISSILFALVNPKPLLHSATLEQFFELTTKPYLFTTRWLDVGVAEQYMHGITVMALSVEGMRRITAKIEEVWLVENETNLYMIPERPAALAICSMGYASLLLTNIPILQQAKLIYWGDLDEDGYKMLSIMQSKYTHLQSIFMDKETLLAHANEMGKQKEKYKTNSLPLRLETEQEAFNLLKAYNGRLEQERIRQDFIARKLQPLQNNLPNESNPA